MNRSLWTLVCAASLTLGVGCADKNDEGGSGGDGTGSGASGNDGGGDDGGDDGGGDDDGGSGGGSGGSGDDGGDDGGGSGTGDDGSATGDDGGSGDDGGTSGGDCMGTHPEFNDQGRWCAEGSCYCASEDMNLDVCYPEDVADECCPIDLTSCGPPGDGGGMCNPKHPEFDPGEPDTRWCEDGWCYCWDEASQREACFDMAQADRCCEGTITMCFP